MWKIGFLGKTEVMTLLEQHNEKVVEETVEEMAAALGLKLCYFGDDDTWGLHSRKSGEVAFINGQTYFSSLEALLKCIVDTGRIVIYDRESGLGPKILINNIFQGCSSLEEIRLKLAIYNDPKE